ncbi:hypothetical protein FOA52_005576 [Chlamydomonas sp. UWO 241]|nr:hypothetical protein FOA52_005576 [Chlamydomonas sp. UWO 241]
MADDARALVARAEALLEAHLDPEAWGALSDEALAEAIQSFRSCTGSLEAGLAAQGPPAPSGRAPEGGLHGEGRPMQRHAAGGAALAAPQRAGDGGAGGEYEVGSVDDLDPSEWQVPPQCVPIHANVTTYDWAQLHSHTRFDVIMMDPPWQLATANPTRGVSLGYSQLTDNDIANLPVLQLQSNGFLFIWVINAKYKSTLDLFERWGYTVVDEIVWCKMTVNRRLAKSHGYYLQHAKEICLVGKRGADPLGLATGGVASDVIFSERRGQSQKPEEIYELIEELVPNGRYLEIFARKNNLRNFWVSIGNEVTGTGLPEADLHALRESACIPNAVYGRSSTRANA